MHAHIQPCIQACENAGCFVDTAPYLLHGEHASAAGAISEWSFNATESRKRAAAGGCLDGLTFYVTSKTQPKPDELKLIIRAAGGALVDKPPTSYVRTRVRQRQG